LKDTFMPVRVSLAMPIYNGEQYVEETIRSILVQDFTDFELIITDNASTDRTEEICRGFAARDSRVRYMRNERNLGAAANYNLGLKLAQGEYFKWCAHDDLISPNCVGALVSALDQNSEAILAFPKTECIDETGALITMVGVQLPDKRGLTPAQRFMRGIHQGGTMFEIFGLFRRDMLHKTMLHLPYYGSDRALLAEVALLGEFVRVPTATFFNREHRARSINIADKLSRARWQSASATKAQAMEHCHLLAHLFAITGRHCDIVAPSFLRFRLIRFAIRPLQIGRYAMELLGLIAPGGPTQVRGAALKLAGVLRPSSKAVTTDIGK
jgi:glycosyltransferase involved in cell wall biosynthesis